MLCSFLTFFFFRNNFERWIVFPHEDKDEKKCLKMPNSMTMFPFIKNFLNFIIIPFIKLLNIWVFLLQMFGKNSCIMESIWSGIVENMESNFLIISKSCFLFVVINFFPRFDDMLNKIMFSLMFLYAIMIVYFVTLKENSISHLSILNLVWITSSCSYSYSKLVLINSIA